MLQIIPSIISLTVYLLPMITGGVNAGINQVMGPGEDFSTRLHLVEMTANFSSSEDDDQRVFTYIPPINGNSGTIKQQGILRNSTQNNELPLDQPNSQNSEQKIYTEQDYAELLDEMDIKINIGSDFAQNSYDPVTDEINHYKSLVYRTINVLPTVQIDPLEKLTLYFSDDGRRGYGAANEIILRCTDVTDEEFIAVFVHEIGHLTDLGLYDGSKSSGKSAFEDGSTPIYNNDLSLEFYEISWEDSETLKSNTKDLDFVTGYAKTDAFEDFAESYIFYVLQGDNFREMTQYNNKINQKYEFFKEKIFDGEEFDFSDADEDLTLSRDFDSTILDYNQEEFLD